MKKQVFNPYLPSYEYIPDGEPRVFNGRLYIYGSHDRFNGDVYCANDYVCWSAPENDLSDWRYEGVIFRKTQDPRNPDGAHVLVVACDGSLVRRIQRRRLVIKYKGLYKTLPLPGGQWSVSTLVFK